MPIRRSSISERKRARSCGRDSLTQCRRCSRTAARNSNVWELSAALAVTRTCLAVAVATSDGSVRRTWVWSSLQDHYDAIAVLPDRPVVVARHAALDYLTVHDLRAGAQVASLPLPGVGFEYHGPSCTSGTP